MILHNWLIKYTAIIKKSFKGANSWWKQNKNTALPGPSWVLPGLFLGLPKPFPWPLPGLPWPITGPSLGLPGQIQSLTTLPWGHCKQIIQYLIKIHSCSSNLILWSGREKTCGQPELRGERSCIASAVQDEIPHLPLWQSRFPCRRLRLFWQFTFSVQRIASRPQTIQGCCASVG